MTWKQPKDPNGNVTVEEWNDMIAFILQLEEELQNIDVEISSISDISDVNTSGVSLNKVLKWNGNSWVPGTAGDTDEFTFDISSFNISESGTYLIGDNIWKDVGEVDFSATYINGPPNSAVVALESNGGVSWDFNLDMGAPDFDSATNVEHINYPNDKDRYIRFRLTANNRETTRIIWFRNRVLWGTDDKSSNFTSSDLSSLSGQTSNNYTRSVSLNATSGNYLIFAHPASYSTLHNLGFRFNGITCPFESYETVGFTNSEGFTENYKVYRSTLSGLGSGTLSTSTNNQLINRIYWGTNSNSSGYSENNIKELSNDTISNSKNRSFTVNASAGQYIVYSYPTRLGTSTFFVGGFEGGFGSPETVSVTNANGYTEDYYVYISNNSGLGNTTVTVQ